MRTGTDLMIDAQLRSDPALCPCKKFLADRASRFLTWDAIGEHPVALYMEAFSGIELRELTGFYRTPTGQKVLKTLPGMMQGAARRGMAAAEEHQAETRRDDSRTGGRTRVI